MMAFTSAFDRSFSSLASKRYPRAIASFTIFCQTDLLLAKVVTFPTIHKQCLQAKEKKKTQAMFF
jgi:hypothetical protein